MTKQTSITLLAAVACMFLASGCATLEKNPDRDFSLTKDPAPDGPLADADNRVMQGRTPNESAFLLVPENDEALQWRLAMIDSAVKSIDIQTFIWANDEAGRLIAKRLFDAAKRGVRVRILIDDFMEGWKDAGIYVASLHENTEIRRFNPGRIRSGILTPLLEMGLKFETLNRRMHNKQMVFDNRWAIVGGRNIDNHYFGLHEKYNFRDMDLLLTGDIVEDLADDFDEYWNSPYAYPGSHLLRKMSDERITRRRDAFYAQLDTDRTFFEKTPILFDPQDWSETLNGLQGRMVYGVAVNLQDPPVVRGNRKKQEQDRLLGRLGEVTIKNAEETHIISPYLIPPDRVLNRIREMAERGGRIHILTASLASNNHTSAHSHYKKYRKRLIRAGAELWEFNHQPGTHMRRISDTPPIEAEFISLHIKAFVQDRRRVYMGSLNLDPRSLDINTENIMVIESPDLAAQLIDQFDRMTQPENAWKVYLDYAGHLQWNSAGGHRRSQPARSPGQRVMDFTLRLLPIEGQL